MAACEQLRKENKQIVAIVTWTFTGRYEFRFNYHTNQRFSPWYNINIWSTHDNTSIIEREFKNKDEYVLFVQQENMRTAKQTGIADFAKMFFKHVGDSEYYELFSSFKEMLFLQLYFQQNNILYMFLTADNQFYQHPAYYRQKDIHLDVLYNQIDWTKWFFFEGGTEANHTKEPRGFYQWAVENKYPIGTTHPLEEAHQAAAELIKDKFNELVKKSLE